MGYLLSGVNRPRSREFGRKGLVQPRIHHFLSLKRGLVGGGFFRVAESM
jgi:hypothetical protein